MVFAVLSAMLMIIDHQKDYLASVRSTLSAVVYPIQYVVNLPFDAAEWVTDSLVTRKSLLQENERLKKEHLLFSSRLQRYEILESENERLRQLLESSFRLNDKVLVAELIEVQLQSFRRQIVINKGKREGAYDGQPIVDAAGIMGMMVCREKFLVEFGDLSNQLEPGNHEVLLFVGAGDIYRLIPEVVKKLTNV